MTVEEYMDAARRLGRPLGVTSVSLLGRCAGGGYAIEFRLADGTARRVELAPPASLATIPVNDRAIALGLTHVLAGPPWFLSKYSA